MEKVLKIKILTGRKVGVSPVCRPYDTSDVKYNQCIYGQARAEKVGELGAYIWQIFLHGGMKIGKVDGENLGNLAFT